MVAYLITQYHLADNPSNNSYNDGIQEAIWTLMDPTGVGAALPNIADPTSALKEAAQWYANPNSNKSFLADFRIISDTAMQTCGTGLGCGFQEQMFDPMMGTVPEPRGQLLVLLGLLGVFAFRYQRNWKRS